MNTEPSLRSTNRNLAIATVITLLFFVTLVWPRTTKLVTASDGRQYRLSRNIYGMIDADRRIVSPGHLEYWHNEGMLRHHDGKLVFAQSHSLAKFSARMEYKDAPLDLAKAF